MMLKSRVLLLPDKRAFSYFRSQSSLLTRDRFSNLHRYSVIQQHVTRIRSHPFTSSNGDQTTNQQNERTFSSPQKHLAKVIYRQILRWCDTITYDVPFDPTPPVTLGSPRIDEDALSKLIEFRSRIDEVVQNHEERMTEKDDYYQYINNLLPPNTVFHSNGKMITIPLSDAADLRSLIRVTYRLNSQTKEDKISKNELDQILKDRVSLGFDVLRSLTDLSEVLEKRKEKRIRHFNRDGINYKVGQVLQHKSDRWRGVVTGWKHFNGSDTRNTSLTKKNYNLSSSMEEDPSNLMAKNNIQYELLIDSGDAHLLESRPYHQALQSELQPVTDPSLCRIRSHWVQNKFDRYDDTTHSFSPSRTLAYEYPMDRNITHPNENDEGINKKNTIISINLKSEISKWNQNRDQDELMLLTDSITKDIKKISSKLKSHILDLTSLEDSGKSSILSYMTNELDNLMSENTSNHADKLDSNLSLPSHETSFHHSMSQLRGLLNIVLYTYDLIWHRQNAILHKNRVPISLGSIVRHKKYGYRGVVVGWDPSPTVDVSRWDGLSDVKGNVNEMPFYHVVPDNNDCLRIFGSERKFRYVCDENLEICHGQILKDMDFDIGLENADGWDVDEQNNRMIIPQYSKFKYGESLEEDNDVTLRSMQKIEETLTQMLIDIRGNTGNEVSDGLTIVNLFHLLQSTENLNDATVVEELIREVWKVHDNSSYRWKLEDGIVALLHGSHKKALSIFEELTVKDPMYFEAWNRMSTCQYLLGNMEKSLASAQKTLELQPLHFQAFNGLGLCYYETGQYLKSIEAFRFSIILDPWSPSSSKLSACLDLAQRSNKTDQDLTK